MATAGYTTIGANTQSAGTQNFTNNPQGLLISFPSPATVSQISAYVAMTSSSRLIACKIYTGSAGSRGTLVATTNNSSVTNTFGWVDFPFASSPSVSATTYWIEFEGYGGDGPGSSTAQIKYDTGGATNTGLNQDDFGVPQYNTFQYSLYATYTSSGTSSGFVIALV